MVSFVIICIFASLAIPLLIAMMESNRNQLDPQDDGAWTLARALMGGCHVRWTPDPTPIVWFDVNIYQARIHAYQRAGDSSWWIEGRIYLKEPLQFAARLCTPKELPLKITLKGMKPFELPQDANEGLGNFSIETNDEDRFTLCFTQTDIKDHFKVLRDLLKLKLCEVWITNHTLVIRGNVENKHFSGEILESYGPQLAQALRSLTESLTDFTSRQPIRMMSGRICPVSAHPLTGADLWSCPLCAQKMHRVAMELFKGCMNPSCENTTDGIHDEVIYKSRPLIVMKEVEASDLDSMQWIPVDAKIHTD